MRRVRRTRLILCGLAAGAVAGCAVRGDTTALERELRIQEDRIVGLETELRRSRDDLTAARRDADAARVRLASTGEVAFRPEQADVLFRAEGLRINRLLTGGLDADGRPGPELLHVVLEPYDAAGNTLKLPGEVTVDVTDPAASEESREVGRWTFTADEAREAWHAGLFSSGLKLRLPWTPPPHESVVVHARLTTSDGRTFDATEVIRVAPGRAASEPIAANLFGARQMP